MRVFYCDHHEVPLPPGHVFPMEKYRRLRRLLLEEDVLSEEELHPAPSATLEELTSIHDPAYVGAVLGGTLEPKVEKRIGFPWSEGLVSRTLASVGGTLAAARAALEEGTAGNLAGGTHHAHRDFGAGYCVFNDAAVASSVLLSEGAVEQVLVFDVDVHQGDGTAAIFADEPRVFTTSIHGAKNFPARKQVSDLDIELPDGADDGTFLGALDRALAETLERCRPDLVLVQGGVDGLANDKFGRLGLTHDGLRERDRRIFEAFAGRPVALTLGGGYARPIDDSVRAYLGTYRAARDRA